MSKFKGNSTMDTVYTIDGDYRAVIQLSHNTDTNTYMLNIGDESDNISYEITHKVASRMRALLNKSVKEE